MWILSQELDENTNRPQLNVIENQKAALPHHVRRVKPSNDGPWKSKFPVEQHHIERR
jgi:hypothetical protein